MGCAGDRYETSIRQVADFDENEDVQDIFQKIMYLARPEHIREVWVQGEKVHTR